MLCVSFSQAVKDPIASTQVQVAQLWTFDRSFFLLITLRFPGRLICLFPFPIGHLIDGLLRVRLDRGHVTLTPSVVNLYIDVGDFGSNTAPSGGFLFFDP